MSRDTVFPTRRWPTIDELVAMGREMLMGMQHEAATRIDNLTRLYGINGNARIDSYKAELRNINKALLALDASEGKRYQARVFDGSREDIAERLVLNRSEALVHRYDEGVDEIRHDQAMAAYANARSEAKALERRGYPLTPNELSTAEERLKDRRWRMKHGVRRMDPKSLCPKCKASILSESIYCPCCGEIVGERPLVKAFVCHASVDKNWCLELVNELKKRNIKVWIDIEELAPGDSLQGSISQEISSCDIFIFVASRVSLSRTWPMEEMRAAIGRRMDAPKAIKVIPVLIDNCEDQLNLLLKDTYFQKFHQDGKTLSITSEEGQAALQGILKGIAKHCKT